MVRSLGAVRIVSVLRNIVAGFVLALLFLPATFDRGFAATDLAVAAWVKSINASPDWAAEIRDVSVDERSGTVTIGSLLVAAKVGGVVVEIEGATLPRFAEARDGGFTSDSLQIASIKLTTIGVDVVMNDINFDDIGVPALRAIAYDSSKPFTSLISVFSALAKTRTAGGRVADIEIFERFEGQFSRISYKDFTIGRVANGKIDGVRVGPLRMESPVSDPIAVLTIANVEAGAIDLDAYVHVYDPLRYIAGTGDGASRRAIDSIVYSDIAMTLPSLRLTLDSIAVEDFRLRQPRESFSALIDATMARRKISPAAMDALTSRYMAGLLSAHGVGRLTVKQVELTASGIDQLTLESFTLSEVASDRFGEIGIEGFVGAIAGQGAIAVERVALGDVVLPDFNQIKIAADRAKRGADIDTSSLTPKFGALEAIGINIQAIDFPGVLLGRMRADFDNYLGNLPTEVTVDIKDFDIATSSLRPDRLRNLVAGLGYDRMRTDATFDLQWREADGSVTLEDFRIDIEDFGNIAVNILFGGLTRQEIESREEFANILADLNFEHARVTFEDKSVVERSLSMRAELLNIPLDRLRKQLAGALPLMLAFLGNPEMVKEIVPVLQTFIKSPGTLTIEAGLDQPVPVSAIEAAMRRRPQSLPGMLGISITGTPGR